MSSDVREWLEAVMGEPVAGLRRLSGGASRETWAFEAGGRGLVLRRDPPGGAGVGAGVGRERVLLDAARGAGVPVPAVIEAGDDHLVMEHVEGETIPRKILRDAEFAEVRPRLAAECGRVLAALHRMPVDGLGLETEDPVGRYRELLDTLGGPHPTFEVALRWLEANRPTPATPAVVHGDFRNGNLMVGPDGIRAVLDWELTHVGDPVEDLGWLCVRAWRFGSRLPVGGFGERDELVASYEAAGGRVVDADRLRWWEVMGTLKWGVMCIVQRTAHTSGAVRSVELAAIGRRVCENEWDLLELVT